MTAFVCQVSAQDWRECRAVGLYGNREGTESDDGEVRLFSATPRGANTVLSIIEDLVGMTVGDTVFFHVVYDPDESSTVRGVYQVTREPFFDDTTRVWSSSDSLVYPYRFGFGAHPDFRGLAECDAAIRVEALYREIEGGRLRSILTLERETNGPAHAIKTLASSDGALIARLLLGARYRPRPAAQPVALLSQRRRSNGPSLASRINHVGRYEFAVKALLVHRLAHKDRNTRLLIPACSTTSYDVLVESFIGPTVRRPSDLLCVGNDGHGPHVTVVEAKTDRVRLDDVGQVTRYLDIFRTRNRSISGMQYSVSGVLLGQRLDSDLRDYTAIRNQVFGVEPLSLVEYLPNDDGTDASFRPVQGSAQPGVHTPPAEEMTNLLDPLHSFDREPAETYRLLKHLRHEDAPEVSARSRTDTTIWYGGFEVRSESSGSLRFTRGEGCAGTSGGFVLERKQAPRAPRVYAD